jgi:hypothetical protein
VALADQKSALVASSPPPLRTSNELVAPVSEKAGFGFFPFKLKEVK